ncbi:heparin lyase I family protein [Pseudoprimorskyibacter insulae]|uniref:Alginate lyase 2 domain-containing protein n=1 Tax=Pseudoprimorskyibacter insulae TaxID=1695997 RepID=A0A2R8AVE0_9RHOB|nr:heparin lyase I family protein [Pseudoprimorskyibacter insulae]SPF79998.1 hypothetical protein PRI8871_01800 [Pseudoprimorskyibacter insulae]
MRILLSVLFVALSAVAAPALEFKDGDWTTSFYESCKLPVETATANRPRSIQWAGNGDRKLAVTLAPGDKGRCTSDGKWRHGAPYWERAELKQRGVMGKGKLHQISFTANFAGGFTGREETFFQIHGWNSKCDSAPLFMLKWHGKKMQGQALVPTKRTNNKNGTIANWGKLETAIRKQPRLNQLQGKDTRFEVDFDTRRDPATVSMRLNGQTIVNEKPVFFEDCATPTVKLGIYRPGRLNKSVSTLFLDDIRIVSR